MNGQIVPDRDIRQRDIVPPERLVACQTTVVGVGAIGRQVALQLAAMGVPSLELIDPDRVEPKNLACQGYLQDDLGRPKVHATADLCHLNNYGLRARVSSRPFESRWPNGSPKGSRANMCCLNHRPRNSRQASTPWARSTMPRRSFIRLRFAKRAEEKGISGIPRNGKYEDQEKEKACTIRLTTQERKFLKDVWKNPTSTITERYRRLGLSSRCGNEIQKALIRRRVMKADWIVLPTGRLKTLSLTQEGRRALGLQDRMSDRQGGAEHKYWVCRLAECLRAAGYDLQDDSPVGGGKTIDLLATRDGKRIAFEIETGKSDAVANARKCLNAGMDEVILVATSTGLRDTLVRKLPRNPHLWCATAAEALSLFARKE